MICTAKQGRWLDVGYSLMVRTIFSDSSALSRWVYLSYLFADRISGWLLDGRQLFYGAA